MKQLLIYITCVTLFSCSDESELKHSQKLIDSTEQAATVIPSDHSTDSITDNPDLGGYDELSNDDSLDRFTISEYNTDYDEIENIKRPGKSSIENSAYPTKKLFGIWVQDPGPDVPHATFQLTEESFFVVDYDGDGDMPYQIKNDSITVYYNDFIQRGKILASPSGQLKIHWKNSDRPTIYYTWKN